MSRGVFWRVYARWYDALWDTGLTAAVARRVVQEVPPELPVIELGAGTGLVTRELAAARRVVRACEPDPDMRARLVARDLDVEQVTDESIEECHPPAGDCCVVAVNVLHLVADVPACLEHLRWMAGPHGRVVVVVPTAQATLGRVARAHRSAGAGATHSVLFLLAHVVLGPLAALAGVRLSPAPLARPSLVGVVGDVQEVHVLDGPDRPIDGWARAVTSVHAVTHQCQL
ncbi:class I SAM-dependent methyltransferase [Cellulomonas sp. KRMCY2]|uniref:methyltransferase domain-containing protein n=1 Tax=Cellulomonas sp. KRMCY2 TaxID=1304865 RepID=UPI00045E7E81|nr:class I SAM-dependent methyltransferase [Cellulomonas sp. KRMCY2]